MSLPTLRRVLAISSLLASCACAAAGCGGDDTVELGDSGDAGGPDVTLDQSPSPDAGPDTTTDTNTADTGTDSAPDAVPDSAADATPDAELDAGIDAPVDAPVDAIGDTGIDAPIDTGVDAPVDAGPDVSCSPQGAACSNGAQDGLCKNSICSPCIDPTDDGACTSAYGGAGNPYVCQGGQCLPGNCHSDANCAIGQICGVTSPRFCGGCTTDAQCKNDPNYGANDMCDTAAAVCVSDACLTPNVACSLNASDECCASGAIDRCVAGNCCTNAQCGGSTPACANHTCAACSPVSANTFFVDPVNGSDAASSSGSGQAGGTSNSVCAFKSIGRALAVVGSNPPAGTRVIVLGPSTVSLASNGEGFPLVVPTNTALSSSGGTVTVNVTPGVDGFRMASPASRLTGFVINGQGNTALSGIVAGTGATATTTIDHVTVQGFQQAGIQVVGTGTLSINPGTTSLDNGTAASRQSGLLVAGGATGAGPTAIIASTGDVIAFDNNTLDGIQVDGQGVVHITGVASLSNTGAAGTVAVRGNQIAGIAFNPVPNTFSALPPESTVVGLLATKSGGDGMVIQGGAAVKVRSSVIVGNAASGILVETNTNTCANCDSNYLDGIDLGNQINSDWGHNTVQSAVAPNNGAGICLSLTQGQGLTLVAEGNVFTAADCSTTAAMLTSGDCVSGTRTDVGIGNSQAASILTNMCTN